MRKLLIAPIAVAARRARGAHVLAVYANSAGRAAIVTVVFPIRHAEPKGQGDIGVTAYRELSRRRVARLGGPLKDVANAEKCALRQDVN